METKYIVTIVVCGTFVLLCLVYLIYALYLRKLRIRKKEEITKNYTDKNLAQMQYDFAVYDKETERMLERGSEMPEEQVTIYDVLSANKAYRKEEVFGKIEEEGIEEITGNYKPE